MGRSAAHMGRVKFSYKMLSALVFLGTLSSCLLADTLPLSDTYTAPAAPKTSYSSPQSYNVPQSYNAPSYSVPQSASYSRQQTTISTRHTTITTRVHHVSTRSTCP